MRHSDDRIPDLNTRGFIAVKNTPVAHSTTAECKMEIKLDEKFDLRLAPLFAEGGMFRGNEQ